MQTKAFSSKLRTEGFCFVCCLLPSAFCLLPSAYCPLPPRLLSPAAVFAVVLGVFRCVLTGMPFVL